jgi:hypothetical protein
LKWQHFLAGKYTTGQEYKVSLAEPELHASETGASVHFAAKIVSMGSDGGKIHLHLTNEYGNSVTYEISKSNEFESLFANLWQFVKDSGH